MLFTDPTFTHNAAYWAGMHALQAVSLLILRMRSAPFPMALEVCVAMPPVVSRAQFLPALRIQCYPLPVAVTLHAFVAAIGAPTFWYLLPTLWAKLWPDLLGSSGSLVFSLLDRM